MALTEWELNLSNIFVTGTIEKLPETVGDQKVIATCRYENKEGQKQLLADTNVSAIALIYENETAALPNIHAMKAELETDSVKFNLFRSSLPFSAFKLNDDGLIPVIVQDFRTAEILMLAYMNAEAYEQTLREGMMTYWSRSRQELWRKGDTSGHYQYVKSLDIDCDRDTILAKVEQIGAACHTGNRSCFYREMVKKEYHDDPVFSKTKVVFSTYNDKFEGKLDEKFGEKAITEGVARKDVALLKDPTYTNINKLAFQYADGIIFNHKDVDDELRTFATDLKKPTLEYPGEQSYIEAYSDFFDKIIE